MYFFFFKWRGKKVYIFTLSVMFFFLPSSSQRFHTRRCVRPVCAPEGNDVALPSWIWWKKKNVAGSVTWRSLKRKSLRLEDEQSQPADLQPERQIFSSLCETESWYRAIRQEFVRAESPDLPSLPKPTPHPSPPWPLIILLNLKPHLSCQKHELFKQTTLTTTLESFFHAQKFEKSFFFLTPWGVGVIPFTNMQTEGTVGGGDKMIQLMLHNRGWIWTKAKLCFLDFMLLLTATCIFLTTFTPAETQLAIETDCMKGHFFWLIILEKADHEMKDDWSPTCCSGWRSCRGCGAAKNPTHPNYFRWSREADSYQTTSEGSHCFFFPFFPAYTFMTR